VGFAQTAVFYDRAPRAAGSTKYSIRKMLRLAWTAALSFSPLPLRISLVLGIVVAAVGMILGGWAVVAWAMGATTQGWTSIFVLVCLIGGAILISNGILGEYVGRIFEESKGRPLYVIARCVGTEAGEARRSAAVVRQQEPQVHAPSPR
jgi:dolichol-phosphate mannosyltransferase